MFRRIAKKDTGSGARSELMSSCRGEVRIAAASKHAKVVIGRMYSIKNKERRGGG